MCLLPLAVGLAAMIMLMCNYNSGTLSVFVSNNLMEHQEREELKKQVKMLMEKLQVEQEKTDESKKPQRREAEEAERRGIAGEAEREVTEAESRVGVSRGRAVEEAGVAGRAREIARRKLEERRAEVREAERRAEEENREREERREERERAEEAAGGNGNEIHKMLDVKIVPFIL
jgi:hypothetical protein